jgi:hypothetical protein
MRRMPDCLPAYCRHRCLVTLVRRRLREGKESLSSVYALHQIATGKMGKIDQGWMTPQ